MPPSPIKAVFFDFMGTCLDWHSSVVSSLPSHLSLETKSSLALSWRQAFFDANTVRFNAGEPHEDIDVTHRRTLDEVIVQYDDIKHSFTDEAQGRAVAAWHHQQAWPDVASALEKLQGINGCEVFVLANGTTRLQLDLVRSSGLRYDMLFSSELLGVYKPAPECYAKALSLTRHDPVECVMVAAHAYDLRAAKKAGFNTVYVYRWTDDAEEDQRKVMKEVDVYLQGMEGLSDAIAELCKKDQQNS